jgi:two-component system, chemotaxis family, chemotaxis protein CheY
MKVLIVDDDFVSRTRLHRQLQGYGECHVAANGKDAVQAFQSALESDQPYNLACLDIMMPEMDGQEVLKQIRALEESKGILSTYGAKIVMTTSMDDADNLFTAYSNLCDGYLVKPVDKAKLLDELRKMKLIQ